MLDLVRKLPDAGSRDLSEIMEKAIEEYLQKHGEGNPAFRLEKWIEDPHFQALPTLGENFTDVGMMKYNGVLLREMRERAEALTYLAEKELRRRGEAPGNLRVSEKRRPKGT